MSEYPQNSARHFSVSISDIVKNVNPGSPKNQNLVTGKISNMQCPTVKVDDDILMSA